MTNLSSNQFKQYEDEGFVSPINIFSKQSILLNILLNLTQENKLRPIVLLPGVMGSKLEFKLNNCNDCILKSSSKSKSKDTCDIDEY